MIWMLSDDVQVKVNHLQTFYKVALTDEHFSMSGVGQGDERWLLENFSHVVVVLLVAPTGVARNHRGHYEANGLRDGRISEQGPRRGHHYRRRVHRYCHFVAGLVGHGLSRLFTASGFEDAEIARDLDLANDMGLFLQKTNIIRDYLEDYVDGRAWWPQEVWKKHSKSGKLGEFAQPEARPQALACLNELVTDALELVPRCIQYMERLRDPQIFCFCAIPQVMAIATLEKCFNNELVFSGVVKICRLCKVMLAPRTSTSSTGGSIPSRPASVALDRNDPNAERTTKVCDTILTLTAKSAPSRLESACASCCPSSSRRGRISSCPVGSIARGYWRGGRACRATRVGGSAS